MRRVDSLEKTLSELRELVMDREAWRAAIRVGHNWATELNFPYHRREVMVLLTVWGCNPIMCSKSKQRKPFFSLKKTKQKKTVCLKKCLNYSQVKLITFFPQKSLSKINTPGKCIYFNLLASHILDTLLVFHIQRHFKNTVSGVLYSAFYHNSFFFSFNIHTTCTSFLGLL